MREFSEFLIKQGEATNSLQRIEKFLLAEEIDREHISHSLDCINNKYAVEIDNGNFFWIKDKYQLI